ncbi:Transducin (beta)-like 1 X-linked receptor 1 [Mortierella sp. AD032]|nr:Transducin (beta)-like 1 X-linked receptor 1 [Mortierella sp. AD032]
MSGQETFTPTASKLKYIPPIPNTNLLYSHLTEAPVLRTPKRIVASSANTGPTLTFTLPSASMDGAQVLSTDDMGMACMFPKNLARRVIKTKLPAPQERIEWTPQLAYSIKLIHDNRLSLLSSAAADGTTSEVHAPVLDESEREWIRAMGQDLPEQDHFQWLAIRIVDEFIMDPLKDSAAVAEVVVLGPVLERGTYCRLLSCFVASFGHCTIVDVTLLQGLVLLIESASPGYLVADDLMRALQMLGRRLMEQHMMSSESLYRLTSMICRLLDVTVSGSIMKFNRVINQEQLVDILDGLLDIADPILQFQGNYALQAFRYIADGEPVLQTVLRLAGGITEAELEAAGNHELNPANLSDSLNNLRQAAGESYEVVKPILEGMEVSQPKQIAVMMRLVEDIRSGTRYEWYLALLAARTFVRDGRLADFNRTVCDAHCRDELFFQLGVCQILGEIAMDPVWDHLTRQLAVDFLSTLYKGELGWQHHNSVVQWLFAIITQASELLEPAVRDHALVVLKDLGLDNTAPPTAFAYSLKSRPPLPELSPLLAKVLNIPQIESDLQTHKKRRLDEGQKPVYIPPLARANLQAPDDYELFPLMDKVQEFLASCSEVMLILGDSGSGKSTFNRYLERKLWMDYKSGSPIPLFINLPDIDQPELNIIDKQLRAHGFSDIKIQELKQHHRFILICDGYDESQLTTNLHTTNQLNRPGQWDVKLIITCRIQHLGANYRDQFVPRLTGSDHSLADDLFQEAVIAPFSNNQIVDYIDQHVPLKDRTWTKEDYMDKLVAIPNIMDLCWRLCPVLFTIREIRQEYACHEHSFMMSL